MRKGLLTVLLVLVFFAIALAETNLVPSKILTDNVVARITADGKVIENGEILSSEIDEIYQFYSSFYGPFDSVFDEPYVRAYILNEALQERVRSFLAKYENLDVETFVEKYSLVTEADMKRYYEENREELMEDEVYIDLDYAYFDDEERAREFYEKAQKFGYEKALSESSPVNSDSYDGLKRSETGSLYRDILFGTHPSNLRFFATDDGFFVFNIRKYNDMSTYELFKESKKYKKVREELGKKALETYVDRKMKELKINVVTTDGYRLWLGIVENRDLPALYNTFRPLVIGVNGQITTKDPWLLSGLVVALEEAGIVDSYKSDYQLILRYLYDNEVRSWPLLARLREVDNSESVMLDYNVLLSRILIEKYISSGDTFSVFQYIMRNLSELETLSSSSNPTVRQKALEYLYRMYKALEDYGMARQYLERLQGENPHYMNFDEEFKSLEELESNESEE